MDIHYTDQDTIGEGNQGTAYKAKWKVTEVVFKKLRFSSTDNNDREQYLRELQVWRYFCYFIERIGF